MHETTPLTVYGVADPFPHVVQIQSDLVGDVSVRVETDDKRPHEAPEISFFVRAEFLSQVRVVDDSGWTWRLALGDEART